MSFNGSFSTHLGNPVQQIQAFFPADITGENAREVRIARNAPHILEKYCPHTMLTIDR
jgi:hypothetical protein